MKIKGKQCILSADSHIDTVCLISGKAGVVIKGWGSDAPS